MLSRLKQSEQSELSEQNTKKIYNNKAIVIIVYFWILIFRFDLWLLRFDILKFLCYNQNIKKFY